MDGVETWSEGRCDNMKVRLFLEAWSEGQCDNMNGSRYDNINIRLIWKKEQEADVAT